MAENYYDNFTTAIVGWNIEKEGQICSKYIGFETKYDYRKKNGELKSATIRTKDLKYGFSTLNKHTIQFYEDLLSIFNEDIITYICVLSKIEYIISQLFAEYHSSMFANVEFMKYSIIKAINVYQPRNVIEAIYKEPSIFVSELKKFFEEQISKNETNAALKEDENIAFKQILMLLENVKPIEQLEWSYTKPFDGFSKLLIEIGIDDYTLKIDKEGDKCRTVDAAKAIGISDVNEDDSKSYAGIRMADMFAGLISRMMHSIKLSLNRKYSEGKIEKTLLESEWFVLNKRQLDLYKKLYKIIFINNRHWYSTYAGIYSDEFLVFLSLLQFMNHFKSVEEIRDNIEMQPEYFNAFAGENIKEHYKKMQNNLTIEPIREDTNEYFYNQKGAKVYKDIEKQPMLPMQKGSNEYFVLSVGFNRTGYPLITIYEQGNSCCYKLPYEYGDWVQTMVEFAECGMNLFPTKVKFSLIDGKSYVDFM